jgi:large subunit ribosomal protein L4
MRRLAIRSALSDKVANAQLVVVENLTLDAPRTKDMLAILEKLPSAEGKKVLMMLPRRDENVVLSTRNIPTAKVQHVSSINVVELLKHDYVIMPKTTVRWIEMVFGEGLSADEASQKIAAELDTAEEPEDIETTEDTGTTTAEDSIDAAELPLVIDQDDDDEDEDGDDDDDDSDEGEEE